MTAGRAARSESLTMIHDRLVALGQRQDDPAQRPVLERLEELRRRIEAAPAPRRLRPVALPHRTPPARQGLYLWGDVGRGKSMLMDTFFGATAIAEKRRVHFDQFMRDIHAGVHHARLAGSDDPLGSVTADIAKGLRLLAFDEMQVSDIADATIVRRVFEGLFAAGVTIVTTSNRVPGDLYRDGLKRELFLPFIDLLVDRLEVFHLQGATDHRLNRVPGAQVYFCPDNAQATATLDAIWADLTGGQARPHSLKVQGRDLSLPAFHAGMARMTFESACDKPRSPAEYLALAAGVHLLMLDHVPRLSVARYDVARRFVTLVDAMYDAKALLILSAAVEPEALYPEGEDSVPFRRLVSRLREMQSAGWLNRAGFAGGPAL